MKQISQEVLARPVVATGRGGSGTRLLSLALQEHGVFLGQHLNESKDSIEWVDRIHPLAIKKLTDGLAQDTDWPQHLIQFANYVLTEGNWQAGQSWGWKLPETMLVIPEIAHAFSDAKIVHLIRHPLDTCLRRTHVTSRMNSSIGRVTLLAAYQWLNWNRDPDTDDDYLRNAASWVFQVDRVVQFRKTLGNERYVEIKYEDLCTNPQTVSDQIAAFLGQPTVSSKLMQRIDNARRRKWVQNDERAAKVWSICENTATVLGYRYPD